MGLDRIPPERVRTELARDLRATSLRRSHKTVIRFRYDNIRHRLTSLGRYWDRIMRLIEEGGFKRDKDSLSNAQRADGASAEKARSPATGDGAEAARPREDAGEVRCRTLYQSWCEARRALGRSAPVDYERFRAQLAKQRAAHLRRLGCEDVRYDVRVKDGRVALVAKPAKGL